MLPNSGPEPPLQPPRFGGRQWSVSHLLGVLLSVSCLWFYWSPLMDMADRWSHEPQYSHGYLVPVFALYLLWRRRWLFAPTSFVGTPWGLGLVVTGVALRLAASFFYVPWLAGFSLIPCLFGVCLLLGGWAALRWAWPALTFLLFMLPLPFQVERSLAYPLQRVATIASTFCLELLGFRATAQGNIIWVNDATRIGVVEACGGLSMLLTFFALAVAFALVTRRPLVDRLLLVFSALPIALAANVVRITLTGMLHELSGEAAARVFFHDLAGWFMILLALGMLWLELQLWSWLLVPPDETTRPVGLVLAP